MLCLRTISQAQFWVYNIRQELLLYPFFWIKKLKDREMSNLPRSHSGMNKSYI